MLIRPAAASDLPELVRLAEAAGVGGTTLLPDPARLEARVAATAETLSGQVDPADATYLFVLEDDPSGRLAGTCGIHAAVGLRDTWYSYRVGLAVHASRELEVYRQLETLFLTSDLTGSSELGTLFLHPDHRGGGNGKLLSRSRLLFMAEHRDRFPGRVIAEMRGLSDASGRSPFWESLGRHFFTMDYARADVLSYLGSKSFIAELMPRHPIYTCLLSDEARAAIGEVHPATRAARAILEGEGFRYRGYVDIFDAGPTLECPLADVRSVRQSAVVQALSVSTPPRQASPWLVSNRRAEGFRAALVPTRRLEDALPLTPDVLARLGLEGGDEVRAVPLTAPE